MQVARISRSWLWLSAAAALACACSVRSGERSRPTAVGARAAPAAAPPTLLDDFEQTTPWSAVGSDDVLAHSQPVSGAQGQGLGLRFDFQGHGGYAALRRTLPIEFPPHYEISFDLKGDAPVNDFQLKLSDESGENVWWYRRNDFAFPSDWQHITVKQRQIEFAWGPTKDRTLTRTATLEFVVSAGREGGRGELAVDNLRLRPLPPPQVAPAPLASASSSAPGSAPAQALDGKLETAWRSAADAGKEQQLQLDLGMQREFGGLLLRWQEGSEASHYDVELSRDGESWQVVRRVRGGNGGRDAILLTESEARFVRLRLLQGPRADYALAEIELRELGFGASKNAFVAALARESPRGHYPRGFRAEQPYWTLVGADGSAESGLLSEDGALEVGAGGFSIEPFVVVDGQPTSWADARIEHALVEGSLPVPSATWHHADYELEVSAFAAKEAQGAGPAASVKDGGASHSLWSRYTLKNLRKEPLDVQLVLAVRPYQVNPPTQFLNIAGGVSPIHELRWDGSSLAVDGRLVHPLKPPDHVGLASFDEGGFPESSAPRGGRAAQDLTDESGLASAALVYDLRLAPGEQVAVGLSAPLSAAAGGHDAGPAAALPGPKATGAKGMAELAKRREQTLAAWREKLGRTSIRVPPSAQPVVDSLRSALAHILMSRSGPILRPGTRSYSRSWIRDGAMMAESLLRLGHEDVARAYLEWFAPYLFENGKVPCCVDWRGADPVVENDSAGEFIFLVAELFRFTGDRALLERMWPQVEAATRYMEQLRASERTPKNLEPSRRAFYGLMPPSISHEGYSDKPAYSYWDNFWAQIGYEDAVMLAGVLGKTEAVERLTKARDQFRDDLINSLKTSAAYHGVNYLPGSADRGDFDATSTTIALAPGRAQADLPRDQLLATFERYYEEFEARRDGKREWKDYTPYELRVVGTFVRLGQRERAEELLKFFFGDQRPQGWNQWAEVVGRDPREPRFIGDMPHAWIASDYIRSALDLFAYSRQAEQQLVLAAGIPLSWFEQTGIKVERLRTDFGFLSYAARRQGKNLTFELMTAAPPGGFVIPWPWEGEPGRAWIDGKEVALEGRELHVNKAPARVVLEPR